MFGYVTYTASPSELGGYDEGLFQLPKSATESFRFMGNAIAGNDITNWGGVLKGNDYYLSIWWPIMPGYDVFYTLHFDMTNPGPWNSQSIQISNIEDLPVTQTYSPADDKIYSINHTNSGLNVALTTMEYSSSSVTTTKIADLPGSNKNYEGLASDASGNLYCIYKDIDTSGDEDVMTDSRLIKIDRATGAVTTIGSTGLLPIYRGDATIDLESGRMFWTVSTQDKGSLAEVNLSTGAATILFDFSAKQEVVGLITKGEPTTGKAPGRPDRIAVEFGVDNLSGTVSFNTPDVYYDNSPADTSEPLTYHILVNGTELKSGTSTFGKRVSDDISVTEPGEYIISVYCSNDKGDGADAKFYTFIGPGLPDVPQTPVAYYVGGNSVLLTYYKNSQSVDGGYIDSRNITFNISRKVNGGEEEILATEYDDIEFTDNNVATADDGQTVYEYFIRQVNKGRVSAPGVSNSIIRGNVTAPYSNGFANADEFARFGVVRGDQYHFWTWDSEKLAAVVDDTSSQPKNDWLISPGIYLEAGKVYDFSIDSWTEAWNIPENIEVKFGRGDTPDALTTTLIDNTSINNTKESPRNLTSQISAEESGIYFIGIHAISPAAQWMVYVDNFNVGEGLDVSVPGSATNLNVVAAANGNLSATISLKAPEISAAGNPLSSISKIELSREKDVIHTFTGVTPGQNLSFTDNSPANGENTYSATAYNEYGAGAAVSASAYVGVYAPTAVTNVVLSETENDGEVTVTWTPVTKDVTGIALTTENVKYNVYKTTGTNQVLVGENLTEPTYTFRYVSADSQELAMVRVCAVTAAAEGAGVNSEMIPVGKPYAGLDESFSYGSASYDWGVNGAGGGQWALMTAESGADPYDNDNGFIAFNGTNTNSYADFFSGKISLAGMAKPAFSLRAFPITNNANNNHLNILEIEVREVNGEYTKLYSMPLNELGSDIKWYRILLPLDQYAGKNIQFRMRVIAKSHSYTLIDALKIASIAENDIAISKINAPYRVRPAKEFYVNVDVENIGRNDAENVQGELYLEGKLNNTINIGQVKGGDKRTATFPVCLHALTEQPVEFYVKVTALNDDVLSNNTSRNITANISLSNLPYVNDLTGSDVKSDATLVWSQPDINLAVPELITESFEDAQPFAKEFEGWTFVDADQGRVGGFNNLEIPGITPEVSRESFFIFDTGNPDFSHSSFAARSGSKYIAALYNADNSIVDDWAISPLLSGDEQTIRFFAKSYSIDYPEVIEILTSSESTDIADFVHVPGFESLHIFDANVAASTWHPISFNVPAGTKYFAIRNHSRGAFMLMLDDFEFIPAINDDNLSLVGYNVYRDGSKINDTPVAEPAYTDPAALAARSIPTYRVTAVYDKGESKGSNEVVIIATSVNDISSRLSIRSGHGFIYVDNAGDSLIRVHSLDGKTIYSGHDSKIAVAPGIYLVEVSETTAKVMVR